MKKIPSMVPARMGFRMAAPLYAALAFACSAPPNTEPAGSPAPAESSDESKGGESKGGESSSAPPNGAAPQPTWPGRLAPTADTAQALFDRVIALYRGHAAAAYPAGTHQFSIQVVDSGKTSASADISQWLVKVDRRLIERDQVTLDVLATFVCHEVGHLVAGYPFKRDDNEHDQGSGVAAEGQSDYYAAKDCLPRLWAAEPADNAIAASLLGESERARCAAAYPDEASRALCGRILFTGLVTSWIFKEGMEEMNTPYPSFDTPDRSEVSEKKGGYASSQCRLDTLVAGALCNVKAVGTDIPGFLPPYDEFSEAYEVAARPFACQEGPGARPRCWFFPNRRAFDCSATPPYCAIDEQGFAVGRTCTTGGGPIASQCPAGWGCEVDELGNFNCIEGPPLVPEETPEEMPEGEMP
jgi:hypothetical protein